jgi:hypothetical protein
VQELLDNFVQATTLSVAIKKNKNVTNIQGLDGLPYGSLLDVAFVVVQLPHLLLLKIDVSMTQKWIKSFCYYCQLLQLWKM